MSKFVIDASLDASFDYITNLPNLVEHLCSGDPTNRTQVLAQSLGSVALVPGDFVNGNGTPDGRQVTIAEKADVPVSGAGGTHATLCIVDDTDLLQKTDTQGGTVDNGGTYTRQAYTRTIRDAT